MMSWLFKAAGREILPFKDDPADGILDKQLLFGPFKLWCCVVEVYGYCQVLFWLLATAALVFVIWEIARKGSDFWRIAAVAGFFLTSGLLVWFAKGIYVLRLMRKETGTLCLCEPTLLVNSSMLELAKRRQIQKTE